MIISDPDLVPPGTERSLKNKLPLIKPRIILRLDILENLHMITLISMNQSQFPLLILAYMYFL